MKMHRGIAVLLMAVMVCAAGAAEKNEAKPEAHLKQKVSVRFDETPIRNAVEFLDAVTPLDYHVHEDDVPPDGAPVTLHLECSLTVALDTICWQTGMAWKLKGNTIEIGKAVGVGRRWLEGG